MFLNLYASLLIIINLMFRFESLPLNNENEKCVDKILPKALIIGVKKSGTYALIRYLSVNPLIKAAIKAEGCNLNEIHYFDHDINYFKGLEWYRAQMPSVYCSESQKFISIEKTPGYFRSPQAPQRIINYNKDIKLILILRDPVKRLQSELTHCEHRQRKFHLDPVCFNINNYFESLFTTSLNNSQLDNILAENRFIRNSIYYLDMLKWLKYFDMSNFYVINGESFIREPWTELTNVERFLNVSQYISKQQFEFDKKKNFYCLTDSKKFNTTFHGCLGKNKGRKRQVYLSLSVRLKLKEYFQKWNQLFFEIIGKKFDW